MPDYINLIRGGLTISGVPDDAINFFVSASGIAGGPILAFQKIAKNSDPPISGEWVRRKSLLAVAAFEKIVGKDPALVKCAKLVEELLAKIAKYAPGSEDEIASKLEKYEGVGAISPVGIVRCAGLLGIKSPVIETKWLQPNAGKRKAKSAPESGPVIALIRPGATCDYTSLIGLCRRVARSAGVVSVQRISQAYKDERSEVVSDDDVSGVLHAFSEPLGRHDGEDWFIFRGITAEFPKKVAARVKILNGASDVTLAEMVEFHNKFNRSRYSGDIPPEVLAVALIDFGLAVSDTGAITSKQNAQDGFVRESRIQSLMVRTFRELAEAATKERGQKVETVERARLLEELEKKGIKPTTAQIVLSRFGLFKCEKGRCKLLGQAAA